MCCRSCASSSEQFKWLLLSLLRSRERNAFGIEFRRPNFIGVVLPPPPIDKVARRSIFFGVVLGVVEPEHSVLSALPALAELLPISLTPRYDTNIGDASDVVRRLIDSLSFMNLPSLLHLLIRTTCQLSSFLVSVPHFPMRLCIV